jgi:transcriptional regulator with XRE-family HTH domain
MNDPSQLLKEARRRHGVSQKRLAIRASTTQSAISRIESGRVSPTVATLSELMHLLGEDLVLAGEPTDSGIDRSLIAENRTLPPAHRVKRGLAFAGFVRRNRGTARTA